jgi:hypothetical protein
MWFHQILAATTDPEVNLSNAFLLGNVIFSTPAKGTLAASLCPISQNADALS